MKDRSPSVLFSLSEDPNVKVGLLEAGQYVPDMPQINIPGDQYPYLVRLTIGILSVVIFQVMWGMLRETLMWIGCSTRFLRSVSTIERSSNRGIPVSLT